MELVTETTGRPPENYTDLQWQQDFIRIKESINPSSLRKMKFSRDPNNPNYTYHGKTQYQYYCSFINNILSTIRNGESDYCYCIYQVAELLKYEHDKLKTKWLEDCSCFELSLS